MKVILKQFSKKQKKRKSVQSNFEIYKRDKNLEKNFRFNILEVLWKIMYSNDILDMYESNLMRRLGKLFYVRDNETEDIKQHDLCD